MNTKTDFDQELIKTLHSLKAEADVNPSVFFKESTKIRLMNLISDEEKTLEKESRFVFFRNPKFAFKTVGIFLLILLIVSTGTILAAQSANPKNNLYPVKLASEKIALKLSPTPSLKATIAVKIAKRRGDEVTSQQKTDSKSEIKRGIEIYKESINQAQNLVPSNDSSLNKELENEEHNLDELTHEYKNSGQTENQVNQDQKVKGVFDTKNKQSETNTRQRNLEENIQESPKPSNITSFENSDKTTQETKYNEDNR